MTALRLFQQLHAFGVVLTPYPNGTLRYKAPKGTLTPVLVDAMRLHKSELHALVEVFEERAGILEYEAGMPSAEAEACAWACVRGETSEQSFAAAVPDHRGDER